ncbi:MAG: anthranilate synthase component I family protein [Alphaproteobacteria bacterium]
MNLSFRTDVTILGDPLAAYAQLRISGGGGWSGVANNGETCLLSTSPELFFRFDGRTLEARPMKGTAKRDPNASKDRQAAAALALDVKERAENLMIVDLLRNDISRIAQVGKVTVPELFSVETYPTVHTLTSTVRGEIKPGRDALDALGALFPCGSITGAPKIRAMEIIDELEIDERGPYTGAIGWMAPDGTAEFNVAIRTVVVTPKGGRTGIGFGRGLRFRGGKRMGRMPAEGRVPQRPSQTVRPHRNHGLCTRDRNRLSRSPSGALEKIRRHFGLCFRRSAHSRAARRRIG